jgi:hypothetical protein
MAPGINKEKDRALSLTGSITSTVVDKRDEKDLYLKI